MNGNRDKELSNALDLIAKAIDMISDILDDEKIDYQDCEDYETEDYEERIYHFEDSLDELEEILVTLADFTE